MTTKISRQITITFTEAKLVALIEREALNFASLGGRPSDYKMVTTLSPIPPGQSYDVTVVITVDDEIRNDEWRPHDGSEGTT